MSRACREADVDSVRLQSSDGETFEVSLKVARLSRTIDTMLKGERAYVCATVWLRESICSTLYRCCIERMSFAADLGHEPDDLIPLPKVNSRILKKVYIVCLTGVESGPCRKLLDPWLNHCPRDIILSSLVVVTLYQYSLAEGEYQVH